MESRTKKILIISTISLLTLSIAYYFLFIKDKLTEASFEKQIEVVEYPYNESEVKNWDEYADENSFDKNIDAVMAWGDIYLFNADTYWYENEKNDYYDAENESLVIGNTSYHLAKDNVEFGYVNNDGDFIA